MLSIWTSLEIFCLVKSKNSTKQQNFGLVLVKSICRRQNECDSNTEIYFRVVKSQDCVVKG